MCALAFLSCLQVLWVNMVTAATLGLVIGIEEPEEGVMKRKPRRPGKALVGGRVVWRTLFVGLAMICVVLGNAEWTIALGKSRTQAYTVALNTLVTVQSLYVLSCRYESRSSVSWSGLTGNPWLTGMVLLNAGLQCLLTYTPALQPIFETAAIDGADWARVVGLAVAVFVVVEAEKVAGPRYIHPYVAPRAKACARWLRSVLRCGPTAEPETAAPQDLPTREEGSVVGAGEMAAGTGAPAAPVAVSAVVVRT